MINNNSDNPISPRFSFESFLINEGNQLAVTEIENLIDNKTNKNTLFVYGRSGTGKTHLLLSATFLGKL